MAGKIELGLECLPSGERQQEYENYLADSLSREDANALHQIFDCFRRTGETRRCLGDASRQPLARDAIWLCQETAELGETSISEHRNRSDFAAELLPLQPTLFNFSDFEREALNTVSTFYSSHLTGFRYLNEVKENLHAKPSWTERLAAYESRTREPTPLTRPAHCSSPQDWERHDLRVDGISYAIPFFLPRGRSYAWPLFEEAFLIGFEFLKAFLTPNELDRLIHPGDRPDIAFFLGGQYHNSDEVLNNCGFFTNDRYRTNGMFRYFANQIALRYPTLWSLNPTPTLNISWPEAIERYLGYFFHEMGHAIDFAFLSDHPNIRASLASLHEWSADRFNPESYQEGIVPLIYYSPRFGHLGEQTHPPAQPHSLKNEGEFFANMVEEFILFETGALWTINNQPYWSNFYQARSRIMKAFFSPEGINPEALTENRIEAAYRASDISLSLPTVWAGTLGAGFSIGPTGQNSIELFGDYATSPMSSDLSLGLGAVIALGTERNRVRLEPEVNLSSNLSHDLQISLFGRAGIGYTNTSPLQPVITTGARIVYHILPRGLSPDLQFQLGLSYSILDTTSESTWGSTLRFGFGDGAT